MEIFSTKEDCCGCTACASICTKNAIKMAKDEEGFLYPHIDTEKCVNCGLCASVCPVKNNRVEKFTEQKAFIVRSCNEENVSASTSGGFFLPIAEWFIDQGGYVVGVCYDAKLNVVHKITNKKEELLDFRGSKYVQSNQTDTFSEIRKLLKSNKKVLYTGTPCQVAGLKQYLRGNDQNLWCIDVVCHGVPSPKLWEKYISEMRTKYGSNIKDIKFRSKVMGYHTGNMEIHFENGKHYYNTARTDMMLASARGELEITTLNDMYLKQKKLKAQILGRGFAWLDTGTMDSLMEASTFVQTVQNRQDMVISAPEEIAYHGKWITKEKLLESAEAYGKSPYGEHLKRVAEDKIIF